ncbi:MAG: hypothetical protein KDA60_12455 [Planctomycetales bacterium]|nr:hypothetical protein [Planctomycetales bacterium]
MTTPDEPEQPEVVEANWDHEQIAALFADLSQGADIKHVQVRSRTAANRVDDRQVTLQQAHELLQDGRARAIQIYYEFNGLSWCDTLVPQSDSVRIIRTLLPAV